VVAFIFNMLPYNTKLKSNWFGRM